MQLVRPAVGQVWVDRRDGGLVKVTAFADLPTGPNAPWVLSYTTASGSGLAGLRAREWYAGYRPFWLQEDVVLTGAGGAFSAHIGTEKGCFIELTSGLMLATLRQAREQAILQRGLTEV